MIIEEIQLRNFRCFENLTVNLHQQMTVLIAPNGAGKTTVLDALRIAVWPYVKAFDLGSQAGKSATIQIDDVRLAKTASGMEPQLPSTITARGFWPNQGSPKEWKQSRERIKERTNTLLDSEAKKLTAYGKSLQASVTEKPNVRKDLPLVIYLGTGRLWYQGRYTSDVSNKTLDASVHSRLWAYQNCLTATSSYKQFEDWYAWCFKSYREQRLAKIDSLITYDEERAKVFEDAITVVQHSINLLIEETTGWRNLQYQESQQKLVMEHPDHGVLPLALLSDGLRNIVIMISDIAFRCYKLNPHLGKEAASKTSGIVMIDEVDMFLHPSWQQRIIAALSEAFESLQFIVTTHSPQVLTTVSSENIRVLSVDDDGAKATTPEFSPLAHESGDALAQVMGTQREPELPLQEDIRSYEQLVRAGQEGSPEAQEMRAKLEQAGYQFHESDLTTWRFLAERKKSRES